jgi:hypothetical protein
MMRAGLIVAVMAFGTVAEAAPAPAPLPAGLKGLADCRAITDNGARLACYDAATAHLETAVSKHDVVVLNREDMRATRRGLFGFTLPKTSLFGRTGPDSEKDDVAEIDATVTSASSLGYGIWRIRLDDGAVWETTEAVDWRDPRPGSKIHLKRGLLGNYFMTIESGRAVRSRRVG